MTSLDRQSTKLIGYKFNFKDRFDFLRKVMPPLTVVSHSNSDQIRSQNPNSKLIAP